MLASESQNISKNTIFDDRFEIFATIGRGRNSIVYKARDLSGAGPTGDTFLAVKVLAKNLRNPEQNITRLKREALAMLSARDHNVLKLHDFVVKGELCYLSMELAANRDLQFELKRRESPFPIEEGIQLILQVLSGLRAIHRAGILHRDIKPENLLIGTHGEIKIGDFSVSKLPTEEIPQAELNHGVGTFEYLSPEALQGMELNESSDLYSVAITLYQLITGKLPFTDSSLNAQLEEKLAGTRVPLAVYLQHVPSSLEKLFDKALATNPSDRFQSTEDFKEALESFLYKERKQKGASSSHLKKPKEILTPKPSTDLLERLREMSTQVKKVTSQKIQQLHSALQIALQSIQQSAQSHHERLRKAFILFGLLLLAGTLYFAISHLFFTSNPTETTLLNKQPRMEGGELPMGASYIPLGQHSGIIYKLFSDDSQTMFLTSRFSDGALNNKLIITLNIPGFKPVMIDLQSLSEQSELILRSNGLEIIFQSSPNKEQVPGSLSSGQYKDLTTGRVGNWVLW